MSLSDIFDTTIRVTSPEDKDQEKYRIQEEYRRMLREEPLPPVWARTLNSSKVVGFNI